MCIYIPDSRAVAQGRQRPTLEHSDPYKRLHLVRAMDALLKLEGRLDKILMLKEPVLRGAIQFEMRLGNEEHSYGRKTVWEYSPLSFLLVPKNGDYQIVYENDTIVQGTMALKDANALMATRSAGPFYCIQILLDEQRSTVTAQTETEIEAMTTWELSYKKTLLSR